MAELKLIVSHGDFTIEIKDKKPDDLISAYQELLMKLEVLKKEG